MKRLITVALAALFLTGCHKLSPSEINAVAQASVTAAVVAWVAYDNPTTAQETSVITTLVTVESVISGVSTSNTYVNVVYPIVQQYVAQTTDIPAQDKPLVLAGTLATLSGIDLMFASNPTWKTDADNVGSYASSFVSGAVAGLGLSMNDPAIVSAKVAYRTRMSIKR